MPQTITKQQALQRWDALPENLREALVSEINSDFVWKTGENEHLPEEKVFALSRITGYVILGFLHPGDLAQELKEVLAINQQLADSIANKINERVFKPIAIDLEKIYEPPSAFAPAVSGVEPIRQAQGVPPPKPIVVEEIKPPSPPQILPSKIFESKPKPFVETKSDIKTVIPVFMKPAVGGPAPSVIKTDSLSSPQAKVPVPPPPTVPLRPTTQSIFGVENLGSFSRTESKPMASKSDGVEPGPKIIHEEPSSTVPLKSVERFKTEMSQPKFSELKVKTDIPAKPAFLELGALKPIMPKVESKATAIPEPKVVHYTEFRTPTAVAKVEPFDTTQGKPPAKTMPTPQSAMPATTGREIKEITASGEPLKSSLPPAPLKPPTPPSK